APRISPEDPVPDLDLDMYEPSPVEEQFPEIVGPDAGSAPSAAAGEPFDNPAQEPLPSDSALCCEIALDIFDVDLDSQGSGLWKALEECAVVAARPGQKRRVEVSFRKLGPEDREKFKGAMKKEWQSWLENKVTTIAKGKGVPKSRIIGSRWVLTWKKSSDPDDRTLSAKARLVLVGFQDPDLGRIATDSPTLRKESKHVILSICASKGWVIWGADIKTAFLSGDNSDRQLYFRPPPEVRELMNLSDDDVLRLNKAAYGLAEAPRAWFLRLTRELVAVGLAVSQLDPCVFCLRNRDTNELLGICGVHVDDLLGGGTSVMDQCLTRLKIKLPFGEFRQRTIKYTGAEIRQHPDFSIEVTQEAYVDKLEEVCTKPFGKASDFLNEPTLMRACCGQLAWVANHSRPDQTFLASYLQGIQDKALVSHLDLYNKAVREMKARKVSLRFPSVPVDRWRLLAITDAGWGVRANGESQGGLLLCLCDKDVLEQKPGKTWVIEWSSKKLRRVVRSSTAAETLAAQNGLDSIEFAQAFLQEVLVGMSPRQFQQWVPETQSGLVIDSKSLYDALTRSACSSALAMEKRLAIDYAIARACLAERNVLPFWTNNLQMISDCLTKLRGNKEILYKVLDTCMFHVRPSKESGRKEAARKKASLRDMAARSLKQQRSQREPVAEDELKAFVSRVIDNSQLDVLLAEIEEQRPDKMSRRSNPPSECGTPEFLMVSSLPSPEADRSPADRPRGPPPPQPVHYVPHEKRNGPPPPRPVYYVSEEPPRGSAGYGHRSQPAPNSPATSNLFSPSDTESSSTSQAERRQQNQPDQYVLPLRTNKPLPHGVQDVATWGRSLLVLPKYAEKKWSYRQLLEHAWNDREILSYLRWIRSSYYQEASNPVAGKASDLAAFLIAVDYPALERLGKVGPRRVLTAD
ncbi:RE2, partial [Symbiodinium sp. CCMP2456]